MIGNEEKRKCSKHSDLKLQALFLRDGSEQLRGDGRRNEVELRLVRVGSVLVNVVLQLPPTQQSADLIAIENVPAAFAEKNMLDD